MASDDNLPLFAWQPDCRVIVFPLHKQGGKVRDVAFKLAAKTTERHAESYRDQVTTAILKRLDRMGIPEDEQDEQIGAFWSAVEVEIVRLTYQGRRPGGAA